MASVEQAEATMIQNLAEKTGKTLDQWIKIAKASKLEKHGHIVAMLKTDHEIGHGYANLIALRTLQGAGAAGPEGDTLLEAQYTGSKAPMKPIYDALIAAVKKFGSDVEISPKKTYVSLRRSKQFALVQPSTATRVDVGINLKGEKPTARLENSGSFNAMVSHRVRVANKSEVDAQLIGWLKQAYEAA
ncbi:hypothetical protein BH09PLA1_BH09PLA1_15990 [soil metagenome]